MIASELRLGNWVKAPFGELMQVKQLGHKDNPDYIFAEGKEGFGYNEFEGIPLTPEILEKCGFESEYTNGGFLRWQKGDVKLLDRRLPYPQYHAPCAQILHLHQLQNLYFALTGEELTFKP